MGSLFCFALTAAYTRPRAAAHLVAISASWNCVYAETEEEFEQDIIEIENITSEDAETDDTSTASSVEDVKAKIVEGGKKTISNISGFFAKKKGNPAPQKDEDVFETINKLSELKDRGIKGVKVVYSKEEALTPTGWEEEAAALGKRQIPGSVAFVPSVAGLMIAGEVIKDIAGI